MYLQADFWLPFRINNLDKHTYKLKNMQAHVQLSIESFPNFTKGNKSTLLCEVGWPLSAADDFLCTITITGFQAVI